MVGLGWYLDVFGSESHVLVWVFEDFFVKNSKNKEEGKLGRPRALAAAKQNGQNGHPWVPCFVWRRHCSQRPKILFVSNSPVVVHR